MKRLEGQAAIVTGASRGIGLAVAEALLREGAFVCITGRKEESLKEASAQLASDRLMTAAGNAADDNHRVATVKAVLKDFGRLDILVNNTGINPAFGPMVEVDLDAVRKTYDTNVVAALAWIQQSYIQGMREKGGAIVNVASVAGLRPAAGIGAYGISKAALVALTAQLAVELAPSIRVNAVAPAVVRTRFAKALYESDEEAVTARYPLKRLGQPEDVAAAVAFLVSPDAGWITGETIVLDGGLLKTRGV